MLAPETVFTALADNISDIVASHNREFLESTPSLIDRKSTYFDLRQFFPVAVFFLHFYDYEFHFN